MVNLQYNTLGSTKKKSFTITEGTGSFGSTVLNCIIISNIGEIRIFSRNERDLVDFKNADEDAKHNSLSEFTSHNTKLQNLKKLWKTANLKFIKDRLAEDK